MEKSQAEEFANYEVYEVVEEKYHCICLCEDINVAIGIAKILAKADKEGDKYYITNVSKPNTLTWGGGWYYCYWWDKEEGKLKQSSLD